MAIASQVIQPAVQPVPIVFDEPGEGLAVAGLGGSNPLSLRAGSGGEGLGFERHAAAIQRRGNEGLRCFHLTPRDSCGKAGSAAPAHRVYGCNADGKEPLARTAGNVCTSVTIIPMHA